MSFKRLNDIKGSNVAMEYLELIYLTFLINLAIFTTAVEIRVSYQTPHGNQH